MAEGSNGQGTTRAGIRSCPPSHAAVLPALLSELEAEMDGLLTTQHHELRSQLRAFATRAATGQCSGTAQETFRRDSTASVELVRDGLSPEIMDVPMPGHCYEVCIASEAEGLGHQLDNFFPKVRLVNGAIRMAEGEQKPRADFDLDDNGRQSMLSLWEAICRACNACTGREDPRMRDHFTDSLGIFQRRVFKVYVETVNDMNVLLPVGIPRITYGSKIPWQFVVKSVVDWAREAVDVAAVSCDASRRRAPAQSYTEVPPLKVGLVPVEADAGDRPVHMYAEEMACMVVMGKANQEGVITIDAAISAVKNYGRSGAGKELFKEHKWANRPGMMKIAALLRSMDLLKGFHEFDDADFQPITNDVGFPSWMYSITIKTDADDGGHPMSSQIFLEKLVKLKTVVGTLVPRPVDSLLYLDGVGKDWPACFGEVSHLFTLLRANPGYIATEGQAKQEYGADANARGAHAWAKDACLWLLDHWAGTGEMATVDALLQEDVKQFQAFAYEGFVSDAYNTVLGGEASDGQFD
ncbi:unnamed protein product [Prorocentrum cordatum]|uniref:Selenoprotein O n=1 Tax=Prorocentrum cordatum TaxID=2364126 RepID=A0ABN9QLV2_9DINO|nr:unnamed protein product [Polarella glacialis]